MNPRIPIGAEVEFDLIGERYQGTVVDVDGHGVAVRYMEVSDACGVYRKVWLSWAALARKAVTVR